MTMCLVLSASTSRPIFLLPANKAYVFFLILVVCTLPTNILKSA
jgi:hypothetical protein